MEYLVIAFRSRAHTVRFADFLREHKIYNEIVNTPKEAGVGCGLSVKTKKIYLSAIKKALSIVRLESFAGIFSVMSVGGKRIVRSI
jgi:hypothetical protein